MSMNPLLYYEMLQDFATNHITEHVDISYYLVIVGLSWSVILCLLAFVKHISNTDSEPAESETRRSTKNQIPSRDHQATNSTTKIRQASETPSSKNRKTATATTSPAPSDHDPTGTSDAESLKILEAATASASKSSCDAASKGDFLALRTTAPTTWATLVENGMLNENGSPTKKYALMKVMDGTKTRFPSLRARSKRERTSEQEGATLVNEGLKRGGKVISMQELD